MTNASSALAASPAPSATRRSFVVPAPSEPGKIEMYSPAFYAACTVGGILSCGLTHMTVTPLDLVKCNMQILNALALAGNEVKHNFPAVMVWFNLESLEHNCD
ncbi:hypothetical protein QQ045_007813 [Rhodiola kirilowii]